MEELVHDIRDCSCSPWSIGRRRLKPPCQPRRRSEVTEASQDESGVPAWLLFIARTIQDSLFVLMMR